MKLEAEQPAVRSAGGGLSDAAQLWFVPDGAQRTKRVLLIIGTRPEAIKVSSVVSVLRRTPDLDWRLCSTGQHRTMLSETLSDLGIEAQTDLQIMSEAKSLSDIAAIALCKLDKEIADYKPDWVLVQGDTTTAFAGALAAYHNRVPIGHIEAGLRTGNLYSPWPEEANRKLISAIATLHFAPTSLARDNLLHEGVAPEKILLTGNTVIDAILDIRERSVRDEALKLKLAKEFEWIDASRHIVLVTGHRRESFGDGFKQICEALARLAERPDIQIIYPVHLNPNVRGPAHALLGSHERIRLIEPLAYSRFVYLMSRAHIILTDSGGIQEEAPSLGKPVLVMRETSERSEAINVGSARLVGTNANTIVAETCRLLDDPMAYDSMSSKPNPFGDGMAGQRIIEALSR